MLVGVGSGVLGERCRVERLLIARVPQIAAAAVLLVTLGLLLLLCIGGWTPA